MPNTKQPEQNNDWRERWDNLRMEYISEEGFNIDEPLSISEDEEKLILDFITEQLMLKGLADFKICREEIDKALKEQLERVNKEVVGKKEKPPAYSYNPMGNFAAEIRNANRIIQRQKLEKLK